MHEEVYPMRTKTGAVYPVSDLILHWTSGRGVTGVVGIPDGGLLRILDIESAGMTGDRL